MTYPILSNENARELLEKHKAGTISDDELNNVTQHVDGFDFSDECVIEISSLLWQIAEQTKKGKTGWGNYFERRAVAIIHKHLGLVPRVAGDIGFWRWLTFSADGELAELVDWRYGDGEPGSAPDHYFGFKKIKQTMYGYIWLCGNTVYDSNLEDPYELTRRGDVDTWQSHIIRIDFGSVPQLARAFVRKVFPSEDTQTLSRSDYRQLARELTRRNASNSFELFDDSEALEFVERVWEERQGWMASDDTG